MNKKYYNKRQLILSGLIILLSGCTSNISVDEFSSVPNNEILVFGQIKLLGKQEKPFFDVYIKSKSEENEMIANIEDNGYFVWHLKPGKYKITYFRYYGFGRIWVDFEVKSERPVIYIGNLEVTATALSKVSIKNDFENTRKVLDNKIKYSEKNISINLMSKERI